MNWKEELNHNITTVEELEKYKKLPLKDEEKKELQRIIERYPMSIPKNYIDLVDWSRFKEDPIAKLCIPAVYESEDSGSFDTSGEGSNTVVIGLQHKYTQTALMLSTSTCAMYCRFCFRKRLVGGETEEVTKSWGKIFDYLKEHEEINNVLVSGGDSFLLEDGQIEYLLEELTAIDHLDFIRFGTRTPVVFPQRILESDKLIQLLKKYNKKKQLYIVTHYNHPRELTEESLRSISLLQETGAVIRNQSVLLKGVNDDPNTIAELFSKLTANGIMPYYLFQCRPVKGVKDQFQVPFKEGVDIVDKAKGMLNGLAKSFRFGLSHVTGKIEIIGMADPNKMIFKYIQAKDQKNSGRIFIREIGEEEAWLPENMPL